MTAAASSGSSSGYWLRGSSMTSLWKKGPLMVRSFASAFAFSNQKPRPSKSLSGTIAAGKAIKRSGMIAINVGTGFSRSVPAEAGTHTKQPSNPATTSNPMVIANGTCKRPNTNIAEVEKPQTRFEVDRKCGRLPDRTIDQPQRSGRPRPPVDEPERGANRAIARHANPGREFDRVEALVNEIVEGAHPADSQLIDY